MSGSFKLELREVPTFLTSNAGATPGIEIVLPKAISYCLESKLELGRQILFAATGGSQFDNFMPVLRTGGCFLAIAGPFSA